MVVVYLLIFSFKVYFRQAFTWAISLGSVFRALLISQRGVKRSDTLSLNII